MKTPHNTPSLAVARMGTISEGTLRTEDLLDTFRGELEMLAMLSGDYLAMPEHFDLRGKIAHVLGMAIDCLGVLQDDDADRNGEEYQWAEDDAEMCLENIIDLLGLFSPPYCYFGSHEGDGADFGFWPDMESIDELPCLESGVEHTEEEIGGEDYREVNDHGNLTVFGADGKVLIELV